jgi:hypothetical protein
MRKKLVSLALAVGLVVPSAFVANAQPASAAACQLHWFFILLPDGPLWFVITLCN